ncbi:hypothetical protein PR048_024103 [Dryococelus australis]|uniref:Uncharacterized protein n=1 Tax=Dryococelus australis TaxID=614101 RepID=A0ABQ9GW08_9NEOP|nr:hypothetical protein PR048_024103 [Dryococelus australis]
MNIAEVSEGGNERRLRMTLPKSRGILFRESTISHNLARALPRALSCSRSVELRKPLSRFISDVRQTADAKSPTEFCLRLEVGLLIKTEVGKQPVSTFCRGFLLTYGRLHHRGSKLDPRSDLRSKQKTVAPFEFRAGLEIEMKFISNRRNWRFGTSIRDQQSSITLSLVAVNSSTITIPQRRGGRCDVVVRLLASHLGELGGIAPRLSRVVIMPDYAGFLGGLMFPPPFHSGAAPYSPLESPSSALKTSMLKSRQDIFTHTRRSEVSAEQRRNTKAGETGHIRENPTTSGIDWHDFYTLFTITKVKRRLVLEWSVEARAALNIMVLRANEGEASIGIQGQVEQEIPEENSQTSVIDRHNSHARKSENGPAGNRAQFAMVGGE